MMKKVKGKSNANAFEEAIRSIPALKDGYKTGLGALGVNSYKVEVKNPRLLDGSIDVDKATVNLYPEDSRWDYAIGYKNEVYYMEVHPACTSEVGTVIAKKKWLMQWIKNEASALGNLKQNSVFYWIQTANNTILKNSRQERLLAQNGIRVMKVLKLS